MLNSELQSVADAELLRIATLLDVESPGHLLADVEGFLDRWSADSLRFDPQRHLLCQDWRQTWADNGWVCSACVESPGESRQASELLHAVLTESVRLILDSTTERQTAKNLHAFREALMDYLDLRDIEVQEPVPKEPLTSPLVMTKMQKDIWDALEGRALKVEKLADAVGCEISRLYRIGLKTVMQRAGLVKHKHGLGWYRPDAPPPEMVAKKLAKKQH